MRIYQSTIAVGNEIHTMETIEFEGEFWLVPNWIVSPDGKYMKPLRIIALRTLEHRRSGDDFVVNRPIPKAVLNGLVPKELEGQYDIRENPTFVMPNPDELH
jgi:hypothetical protein